MSASGSGSDDLSDTSSEEEKSRKRKSENKKTASTTVAGRPRRKTSRVSYREEAEEEDRPARKSVRRAVTKLKNVSYVAPSESSDEDANASESSEEEEMPTPVQSTKPKPRKTTRTVASKGGLFAAFGFKKVDREECVNQMASSSTIEVSHKTGDSGDSMSDDNSHSDSDSHSGDNSDDDEDEDYMASPLPVPKNSAKARQAKSKNTARQQNNNQPSSRISLSRKKKSVVSYVVPDTSDIFQDSDEDTTFKAAVRESQREARVLRGLTPRGASSYSNSGNDKIVEICSKKASHQKEKLEKAQSAAVKKPHAMKKTKKEVSHDNNDSNDGGSGDESDDDSFEDRVPVRGGAKKGEEEENEDEEVQYRIQFILGSWKLRASDWRTVCDSMNTQEVTMGSVWLHDEDEYYSEREVLIEKYLIKWQHASYVHVSWEKEVDLIDMIGSHAKTQIKKYHQNAVSFCMPVPATTTTVTADNTSISSATAASSATVTEGEDTAAGTVGKSNSITTTCTRNAMLFDDLSLGEFFSPSVLDVDRVLAVDDDNVDIGKIDWERAVLPSGKGEVAEKKSDQGAGVSVSGDEDVGVVDVQNDEKGGKAAVEYLHSMDGFLTVKWEGSNYAEATFEKITDLIAANIDFEKELRKFYRREQLPPAKNARRNVIKRKIDAEVMQTPPTFGFSNLCLRDYQWDGVRWLLFNWSQRRSSILADEMGLGKTIQTAAFLQVLSRNQNVRGPFLVVAPLSTVVNWQREITLWTDFDVVLYHGNQEDRDIAREYDFFFSKENQTTKKRKDGYKLQVVITTPETCLLFDDPKACRPRKELSNVHWDMLVVDEAHKLKNYNSRVTSTLREEFSYSNTLLLTGTPLQNNVEELWTLLNFVAPEFFHSVENFIAEFGQLKESSQLEKLQSNLAPYLLKREKENVETSVPPKEEVIIEIELTVPQKQYYRALYENNKAFLCRSSASSKNNGPSLTNLAMELRKCCNHPFLIRGAEEELLKHFRQRMRTDQSSAEEGTEGQVKVQSKAARHVLEQECIVQSSGKLILLDKLLPKLQADGHKVLIFSQFRIMLDVLQDYIELRKFKYERIDGAITGKRRQQAIDKYSAPNSPIFIMLLSTRAGGVGINLTAADTVIIFDSDWNPQNDIQAQARAHRIGQTKPVKVYRLLTRKTYEMQMFQSASLKLGLDYAIMHNTSKNSQAMAKDKNSTDTNADAYTDMDVVDMTLSPSKRLKKKAKALSTESFTLSNKEIEGLLKHGAYDMFREEKEGISEVVSNNFNDADIDSILARSTVILHDSNGSGKSLSKKLPNFSTASFVSSGEGEQTVDVDDPDFWTKVVGLTVDEDEVVTLGKRKCREKSFINYADNGFNFKTEMYQDNDSSSNDESDSGSDSDDDSTEIFEEDNGTTGPNSSGGDGTGKKSRRRASAPIKEAKPLIPAEWTVENVTKLSMALMATGYGNWEKIRSRCKLHYSLHDIALGCRHLVLYWTRLACMGDDDTLVSRYEKNTVVSAPVDHPCEASRGLQVEEANSGHAGDVARVNVVDLEGSSFRRNSSGVLRNIQPADRDDVTKLVARMKASRLLRLAILSHQLVETRRTSTTADSASDNVSTSSDPNSNNPSRASRNTMNTTSEHNSGLISCAIDRISEQPLPEDEILASYRDSDPVLVKSCFKYWDGAMWTSEHLAHSVCTQIRKSHLSIACGGCGVLPEEFTLYAKYGGDLEQKKAAMGRLLLLDDMFALYHAVFLVDSQHNSLVRHDKLEDDAAKGEATGGTGVEGMSYFKQCEMNADKYAPFNPYRGPKPYNTEIFSFEHIEPIEESLINAYSCELTRYLDCSLLLEDSPTDWWTPCDDMMLVRGVVKFGWPSDKGRYDSLRRFLIRHEGGFQSRGLLEVSPEFKKDLVCGGRGYCVEKSSLSAGGRDSSIPIENLTEKELIPPNSKTDIMKRLKEIIHVLENLNPKQMACAQRQKATFSSNLMLMLGRFGKPVDFDPVIVNSGGEAEGVEPIRDVFTVNELTTAQLATRTGSKVVRCSEMTKVIGAVEAHSQKHMTADDCAHADINLMNRNVVQNTRDKMSLLYKVRHFIFVGVKRDTKKALKALNDAAIETRANEVSFQFPEYWTCEHDLRAIRILLTCGYNAFRFNIGTKDPSLCLCDPTADTPGNSLPPQLNDKVILARLLVLMRGIPLVLNPEYVYKPPVLRNTSIDLSTENILTSQQLFQEKSRKQYLEYKYQKELQLQMQQQQEQHLRQQHFQEGVLNFQQQMQQHQLQHQQMQHLSPSPFAFPFPPPPPFSTTSNGCNPFPTCDRISNPDITSDGSNIWRKLSTDNNEFKHLSQQHMMRNSTSHLSQDATSTTCPAASAPLNEHTPAIVQVAPSHRRGQQGSLISWLSSTPK